VTPLVAYELEDFRRCFHGHVRVLKDFGHFVLVFATPTGCEVIRDAEAFMAFLESHPPTVDGMLWADIVAKTEPFLLAIDPAQLRERGAPQ